MNNICSSEFFLFFWSMKEEEVREERNVNDCAATHRQEELLHVDLIN